MTPLDFLPTKTGKLQLVDRRPWWRRWRPMLLTDVDIIVAYQTLHKYAASMVEEPGWSPNVALAVQEIRGARRALNVIGLDSVNAALRSLHAALVALQVAPEDS